jgi:hypothetical protein
MTTCNSENCSNPVRAGKTKQKYCSRCNNFVFRYGLTAPQVDQMLEDNRGTCKICSMSIFFGTSGNQSGLKKHSAVVDHCHTTGKVRGVICWDCNKGLGNFRDDTSYLKQAIKYLEESR